MPILLPRHIVSVRPKVESPLFFLAGPIRGGGDWQAHMANHLMIKAPDALIACPSRWDEEHWLSQHFFRPFSQAKNSQNEWEQCYMKQAGLKPDIHGCVVFWLCLESIVAPHPGPEPFAMNSRHEIAKFVAYIEFLGRKIRVVIGGDRRFHGLDSFILPELSRALRKQFPFYETMEEVANQAIEIARCQRM